MFQTENNLLDTYSLNGRVTIQPLKGLYFGASARHTESPPSVEGVEEDILFYAKFQP